MMLAQCFRGRDDAGTIFPWKGWCWDGVSVEGRMLARSRRVLATALLCRMWWCELKSGFVRVGWCPADKNSNWTVVPFRGLRV